MLNNEYWEGRYRAEEKARELAKVFLHRIAVIEEM